MEQLTSESFKEVTKKEGLNVVMFSAPWCASCMAMKPQINRFNDDNEIVDIYEINVDDNEEFVKSMGIKSLPSFGFFKNGIQVELKAGYNYMSLKRRIQDLID